MIVADTNLILYLLLETERTPAAEAALERDAAWCAPPLWVSECLGRARPLRPQRTPYARGRALRCRGAREVLGERVLDVATEAVMEQAIARGLSAYDAEFVALAQRLGVRLVTDDRRVLAACPDWPSLSTTS